MFLSSSKALPGAYRFRPDQIPDLVSWREASDAFLLSGFLAWPDRVAGGVSAGGVPVDVRPDLANYLNDAQQSLHFRPEHYIVADDLAPVVLAGQASFFVVLRLPVNGTGGKIFSLNNFNLVETARELFSLSMAGVDSLFTFRAASETGAIAPQVQGLFALGKRHLVGCRFGPTLPTVLRVNGTQADAAESFAGGTMSVSGGDVFYIGAQGRDILDIIQGAATCELHALLIYNRELSDAECWQVEEYLGLRYVDCQDTPVPEAPTDLVLTSEDGTTSVLGWTDHAPGNETGIEIWRAGYTDGTFTEIFEDDHVLDTVPEYSTSYEDVTPDNLAGYYRYKVRAFNQFGYSGFSNVLEVSPV